MTCLWESAAVADVQSYVDETLGDASVNLCYAVETTAAFAKAPGAPGATAGRRHLNPAGTDAGGCRPSASRTAVRSGDGARRARPWRSCHRRPIDRHEHELADWELLADALVGALGARGVLVIDELRRGIEHAPDRYEQAVYHERWLFSVETILVEKESSPRRARPQRIGS